MTGGVQGAGNGSTSQQGSTALPQAQVTRNMFLQLLVAQIRNQDPLNPGDSIQYMTQLAQFQQIEQGLNMGEDIAAIRESVDKLTAAMETNTPAA